MNGGRPVRVAAPELNLFPDSIPTHSEVHSV